MLKLILALLILTPDERTLLANLRKLDKGEQQFFQRAIEAMCSASANLPKKI